jgi:hypothetical protein
VDCVERTIYLLGLQQLGYPLRLLQTRGRELRVVAVRVPVAMPHHQNSRHDHA